MIMVSISVIIPTYNGRHKLPTLLESLAKQSITPDEIIIVIDGSTDGTEEWLREQDVLQNIKVISQANEGRGAARNSGAMNAKGNILIFFDDDVELPVTCIADHRQFHLREDNSILCGLVFQNVKDNSNLDFCNYLRTVEESWQSPWREGRGLPASNIFKVNFERYAFTTANLSCPKRVFECLSGFYEVLNDSEDFDFSIRALIKGLKIFYQPSNKVLHNNFVNIEEYINRQIQYIQAKKALARLRPEYLIIFPAGFGFLAHSKLTDIKRIGFRYNFVWRWLINLEILKKNIPVRLRYKIYDYIISSSVYFSTKGEKRHFAVTE